MKDKTFIILLLLVMVIGTGITAAMLIQGFGLLQKVSIVEMIANWR